MTSWPSANLMVHATQDDGLALTLGGLLGIAGIGAGLALRKRRTAPIALPRQQLPFDRAASLLGGASAVLAFSVLADSGLEHFRGGYHNPVMFVAPTIGGLTLAAGMQSMTDRRPRRWRRRLDGLAVATGAIGAGFHLCNLRKRVGGLSLANLFYGAPIGAPAALSLAGLFGLAGEWVRARPESASLTVATGRSLAGLSAIGLLGTIGEVGLLHFRGAYHNPAMLLPVTIPPVSAWLLLRAAWRPSPRQYRRLGKWLRLTAWLGVAGVGFHAIGIARTMGGWRNWSQSLLAGPPLPAPPSFTGIALGGLGALELLAQAGRAAESQPASGA